MKASHVATANAEKDVQLQKGLFLVAEKPANNSLNDVASLCRQVAAASTHESELPSSASITSIQIVSATSELRQA